MARIVLIALLALAALAPAAGAEDLSATQRVLDRAMRQAGGASGAYVMDLDSEATLFEEDADVPRVPASVEKLYTTATALLRFGPDASLQTTVLAGLAPDETGVLAGDLYLKGGGDPAFDRAAAGRLADALIAETGVAEVDGRVIGDESAFDALRGGPESGYSTSVWVGPLSALSFNQGRTGRRRPQFQASPALFAAQAFEQALKSRGVRVRRRARAGVAPAGAAVIGELPSPPLASLIALTNAPSDNFFAETLLKAVGARFGAGGSTAAGVRVVRATVRDLGARPRVVDGSGLSYANRTSPRHVVRLLSAMDRSDAAAFFAGSLAVAGRTGTLFDRMRRTAARDRCVGKTGTLLTVSALAGYCDTRGGARVAYAFLMNGISPAWARRLQDRMTSALARYEP
jgi:D-alanyl-D-alanine carboxypeptidase/D-alanyl-D-alanine-endopeptidase (penicillin-binding protein 4)